MKKNLLVFISETFGCGLFTFLGSLLGHAFGQTGLFIGAFIGGIAGIALATVVLSKVGLIIRPHLKQTTAFGTATFIIAAGVAVTNLSTPIVPLISLLLVGAGCVIGNTYCAQEENRKVHRFTLIGLISILPVLYFVIGSIIKYNLGFHHSFTLLDWVQARPTRFHYFNIISPFIFIGGILLCLFLNASVVLRYRFRTLTGNESARLQKGHLLLVVLSAVLFMTLLLYLLVENW
jgi:hypothetical protein